MRLTVFYATRPTPFGSIALVWDTASEGPRVSRIVLSRPGLRAAALVKTAWPDAIRGRTLTTDRLADRIVAFLEGERVRFRLSAIALERCSLFQREVLTAEFSIPRGSVATYGGIAAHIKRPGAGRAVGRALATNPFPIVIPCHRAIRSDGSIGGYQGGTRMKRILLERENVVVSAGGIVTKARVKYGTLPGRSRK